MKDFFPLPGGRNAAGSLEENFKDYLGLDYAHVTYSGTAALYFILEALKEASSKKTVIIPSFICPLVPLAITRAGLRVEVCDINKNDFNFNAEELARLCRQNNDILAVIAAHLAGIPLDFDPIRNICVGKEIFIIEDCAQSLGATYAGKKVGALGDVSFFSLCRGKGLTIYEGGVVVTGRKDLSGLLDDKIRSLSKRDLFSESMKIFELFGYWFFYRPQLFWFVFRLPQIFWNSLGNKTRADLEYGGKDFPTHRVSSIRKSIGSRVFARLDSEIGSQREKARYYISCLSGETGIKPVAAPAGSDAAYPFLTLLFEDQKKKERVLRELTKSGLGASYIYGRPVTDYDYLKGVVPDKKYPAADFFSRHHLTLSTSAFMKKKDMDSVIDKIKTS